MMSAASEDYDFVGVEARLGLGEKEFTFSVETDRLRRLG